MRTKARQTCLREELDILVRINGKMKYLPIMYWGVGDMAHTKLYKVQGKKVRNQIRQREDSLQVLPCDINSSKLGEHHQLNSRR